MNKLISSVIVGGSAAVGALSTTTDAMAQYPVQYRGPGVQIGSLEAHRTWTLGSEVIRTPTYQRFDTYAQTPCGPQFVGSSWQRSGYSETVVPAWKAQTHIEIDLSKGFVAGLIRKLGECDPCERRTLQRIAPVQGIPLGSYPGACLPQQQVAPRDCYPRVQQVEPCVRVQPMPRACNNVAPVQVPSMTMPAEPIPAPDGQPTLAPPRNGQ